MKNADAAAYPQQVNGGDVFGGLTKREQFAMAAMQGLLAKYGTHSDVARDSVLCADALLAELERSK